MANFTRRLMKSCSPSGRLDAAARNLASGGGAGEDPFGRSRERFEEIVAWLDAQEAAGLEHGELESRLQSEGRELVRCLFQDHLDLRAVREQRLDGVADARGVERRAVERDHQRPLQSVFGEVTVSRLAYRARGEENLYVADGLLNLPAERSSHGVRRLAAIESAAGSFDHATGQVRERTGLALGKRQVEELAVRAAVDFDAFYAERVSEPGDGEKDDVLVLSADGKGIVMRARGAQRGDRQGGAASLAEAQDPPVQGGEGQPQADRRGRRRLRGQRRHRARPRTCSPPPTRRCCRRRRPSTSG